jgi:hypothetical protein
LAERKGALLIGDARSFRTKTKIPLQWSVIAVEFSPKGDQLAVLGARDADEIILRLYDYPSLREVAEHKWTGRPPLLPPAGPIELLEYSQDGSMLFASTVAAGTRVAGENAIRTPMLGEIHVLSSDTNKQVGTLDLSEPAYRFDFDASCETLVTSSAASCDVSSVDWSALRVKPLDTAHEGIMCMGLLRNRANTVVMVNRRPGGRNPSEGEIATWRWTALGAEWTKVSVLEEGAPSGWHINSSFDLSVDERRIAIGRWNGRVDVWTLQP